VKKTTLLAAILAIVLAAGVPALAQSATLGGDNNTASCVQTAIQQQIGNSQETVVGDNVNFQNISQECNINVTEVENIVTTVGVSKAGKVVKPAKVFASASASAPSVQYQYAAPVVQYQYGAVSLPSTGGSSLIALGVGILLVVGGLLARKIAR
jgi:hypothetical protein